MELDGAMVRVAPGLLGLLCMLLLAPLPVHAQGKIYLCKDGAGHTLSSDRPIDECSNRPTREMDRNGIVHREIPAPLTRQEKEKKDQEAAAQRAGEMAAAEQRNNDRAILSRFRSEDEIMASGQRNTALLQENVRREMQTLAAAERRQHALEAELILPTTRKERLPGLGQQVEEAGQAVKDSRRRLGDYESEILQINNRTNATLQRFRELRGDEATGKR
jgi:hypothetical protein